MAQLSFSRRLINALLPPGKFWEPAAGDPYDALLDGMAENSDAIKTDLDALAHIRNPRKTPILSDLEKEYGVIPATLATEAERRARLAVFRYNRTSTGAWDTMQAKLQESGFDVYVHPNDPAVDPATFLTQAFQMTAGDSNSYAGDPDAYCGQIGGEILVNGDLFKSLPRYSNQCGMVNPFDAEAVYDPPMCGDGVYAGDYHGYYIHEFVQGDYSIPTDPGYWPLFFFVGGEATRDPVTGELTQIKIATIPNERRGEFRSIILKFKPLHAWGGLIAAFR